MKRKRKKNKKANKNIPIIIISLSVICLIGVLLILSFREKRVARFTNIKYGEIEKVLSYLEGDYKEYKFAKVEGFTRYGEDSFLRLFSTSDFDKLYINNLEIIIKEGRFPNNEKEIILPYELKKGFENARKNITYSIGDKISLSKSKYLSEERTNGGNDTKKFEIKYSTSCNVGSITRIDENEILEEYEIVGFYQYKIYKDIKEQEKDFYKSQVLSQYDLITFRKNEDLKYDDRVDLSIYLKTNKELDIKNILSKIERFDEDLSSLKTCNDDIRGSINTLKEDKEVLN